MNDQKVSPPAAGGGGPSEGRTHPKDSIIWWVLVVVAAAFLSAFGTMKWLRSEVKAVMVEPDAVESLLREIEKSRPQLKGKAVPAGAVLLLAGKCPPEYADISKDYDGRYLVVDDSIVGNPNKLPGDGSHSHSGGDGQHTHAVTGTTDALGKGERVGRDGREAPNHERRLTVTGTATGPGSGHAHSGGPHEHQRVGLRLCRAPA